MAEITIRRIKNYSGETITGISFVPVLKNTGQTPAHLICAVHALQYVPIAHPQQFEMPYSLTELSAGVGSGVEKTMAEQILWAESVKSMRAGTHRAYLFGVFAYTDIYHPRSQVHVDTFGYEILLGGELSALSREGEIEPNFISLPHRHNYRFVLKD